MNASQHRNAAETNADFAISLFAAARLAGDSPAASRLRGQAIRRANDSIENARMLRIKTEAERAFGTAATLAAIKILRDEGRRHADRAAAALEYDREFGAGLAAAAI